MPLNLSFSFDDGFNGLVEVSNDCWKSGYQIINNLIQNKKNNIDINIINDATDTIILRIWINDGLTVINTA